MALLPEERETIILFNETEQMAYVDSCNSYILRRCEECLKRCPDQVTIDREDKYGKSYIMPKNFIRINPPKKMNLSEEQKKSIGERLRGTQNIVKLG